MLDRCTSSNCSSLMRLNELAYNAPLEQEGPFGALLASSRSKLQNEGSSQPNARSVSEAGHSALLPSSDLDRLISGPPCRALPTLRTSLFREGFLPKEDSTCFRCGNRRNRSWPVVSTSNPAGLHVPYWGMASLLSGVIHESLCTRQQPDEPPCIGCR